MTKVHAWKTLSGHLRPSTTDTALQEQQRIMGLDGSVEFSAGNITIDRDRMTLTSKIFGSEIPFRRCHMHK